MKIHSNLIGLLTLLALALVLTVSGCQSPSPTPPPTATVEAPPTATAETLPTATIAPEASATPTPLAIPPISPRAKSVFAPYAPQPVDVTPALDQPAIAPDLSNVHIAMPLSADQLARLVRDGVAASPGLQEKEFFTVYEKARYANVPIFITSDSLLHVYHLMFDKTLRTAEAEYFYPLLQSLNSALIVEADAQYQQLRGTPWEDAALRTVAFIAVSGRLADPAFPIPDYAAALAEAEIGNVEAAGGILPSPIFPGLGFGEDYTQYIPRGHYTRSDALKAYFKSMMWYGRMTFRLKTDDVAIGRAETRSALLLVQALRSTQVEGRPALDVWADLYDPTAFLVGRSDDLTALDYIPVIDAVYGENPTLATLADDAKLDTFIAATDSLPAPRILGLVIAVTDDETKQTKGLRFMGQRFVPDAYIFRQLIYRNVAITNGQRRGLPKGLDLFAAMGSERAYELLDEMGDTGYISYTLQMDKMRAWTGGLTVDDWTETVYNGWLYTFYPLLEAPGAGYPAFMQSMAWRDKQLHTCLGSWAELKHDTILYAKQTYAEMGAGWMPTPPDPVPARGYVEPVPEFYARVAALAAMTREGLASRSLLGESDAESLTNIEALALALKAMAEKQLAGIPLTEEEHNRIRYYGGELEHLVMASADTGGESGDIVYMEEDPQAAIIADVATDPDPDNNGIPNPTVLEVGVGRASELHVVVPLVEEDGSLRLQVAKGAIFSYYEFQWPADDRLTDEKWQGMLDDGTAPTQPAWIESFYTPEGEYSDLQNSLYNFQRAWVNAVFYLDTQYVASEYNRWASGAALDFITAEIDALRAEKHFEGRQWMGTDYRSFDRQSADLAVVTVREIWQDTLYAYPTAHPAETGNEDDMQKMGERGPYTLDVTYTLERTDEAWMVTRIVVANARPAW